MQQPIFLVGFMGSGKTTLGKKLANAMGYTFIDLDQKIVEIASMSIPEYFQKNGESGFRMLESSVLKSQAPSCAIVSTGGGSPCFYDNMEWMLQNGIVIYLQLSARALWSRLNNSKLDSRPALNGLSGNELLQHIKNTLEEREKYYHQAHIHIDQLNTPVSEIVEIIKEQQQISSAEI